MDSHAADRLRERVRLLENGHIPTDVRCIARKTQPSDLKSRGHAPGFLDRHHLKLATLWATKLVRTQYLCVTNIGNARIIIKKLCGDPIRNLHSHVSIFGEYLKLYV